LMRENVLVCFLEVLENGRLVVVHQRITYVQQIRMMIRQSMPSVEQIQRKFTTAQQCTM